MFYSASRNATESTPREEAGHGNIHKTADCCVQVAEDTIQNTEKSMTKVLAKKEKEENDTERLRCTLHKLLASEYLTHHLILMRRKVIQSLKRIVELQKKILASGLVDCVSILHTAAISMLKFA